MKLIKSEVKHHAIDNVEIKVRAKVGADTRNEINKEICNKVLNEINNKLWLEICNKVEYGPE